ncbi:RNA polymerase sigma factor [Sphingobacterium lumbrici]|uniref:RNA polymerase sigma factor n=1 Tax=Sphingobacterium lumbrici TaxID=2559600 RepID=UPI001126F9DD|nr:RNA polymerase sigma-70 factor [Sphingobacterium lumbrici]
MNDYLDLEDKELILLVKQDDRVAFTQIYKRYWSSLYNVAFKRTKDREQCQDIVQNVFTDLWSRRDKTAIDNLPAYLHTAVKFQLYKQISRQPQSALFLDSFEEIISSPIRADDGLKEKEIQHIINLWLATLPERRRQIFLLYYKEELSTRDIANRLGLSQNTVQSQIYTASRSLRTRLTHSLSVIVVISMMT